MWSEPDTSRHRSTNQPVLGAHCCAVGEHDSPESVLVSLVLTLEARDSQTAGHCQRLARYATTMGNALKLDDRDMETLRYGGYLHDIGKVGIPDAILLKPGPLTPSEFQRMKQHTTIGDSLCGNLRSLVRVRQIIRSHHERIDGSGYPDGLKGSQIPLLAQIVGLVDAFDALTTIRPYKPRRSVESAFEELTGDARRGWRQPDLVNQLIVLTGSGQFDLDPSNERIQ
jgi:cyclic di-GMP phosphodiesterase